jgi:uncharacterized protein YjeT (DUF2065 family)
MSELVIGFGLVLVIEGLLWAAFPSLGYRLMQVAAQTPEQRLRLWGVIALGLGVVLIWLVKG